MTTATKLLRRALEALKDAKEEISDWGAYADHYFQEKWDYKKSITQYDPLIEEIRAFLDSEPEAEPVAWGQPDACGNIVETITPDDKTHTKAPKGWADIYSVPLYTRPEPARKPMTEEEIPYHGSHYYRAFLAGVRFAEKHHFGIGVNQSDPDSIDLQSRCRGDKI